MQFFSMKTFFLPVNIEYSILKCPNVIFCLLLGCGTVVNNSLKSPGYPKKKYPNNMHCVYSVNISRGMEMKIEFGDFEIEDGPLCL